jgi:hypothetical protein
LSKVRRIVKHEWGWDGDVYEIACAVEADGVSSPAVNFIDRLGSGTWPDPTAELPDYAQLRDLDHFKALTKMLAMEGRLPKYKFNKLDDGVWEIKVGIFRLSFYDTDGVGGYVPKEGDPVVTWEQKTEYRELPDFDEFIRLGHPFNKYGWKTEPADLAATKQVRTEDLKHDEPDEQDEPAS